MKLWKVLAAHGFRKIREHPLKGDGKENEIMGRSRATKPTLAQKKLITQAGLRVSNWLVIRDEEKELCLVNRGSGKTRKVLK